jgi:hypothetical protein
MDIQLPSFKNLDTDRSGDRASSEPTGFGIDPKEILIGLEEANPKLQDKTIMKLFYAMDTNEFDYSKKGYIDASEYDIFFNSSFVIKNVIKEEDIDKYIENHIEMLDNRIKWISVTDSDPPSEIARIKKQKAIYIEALESYWQPAR